MVKSKIYAVLHFLKVPKMPVLQGFFALLIFRSGVGYARSQSRRATNCATPRNITCIFYIKIISLSRRMAHLTRLLIHFFLIRGSAYFRYFLAHNEQYPHVYQGHNRYYDISCKPDHAFGKLRAHCGSCRKQNGEEP